MLACHGNNGGTLTGTARLKRGSALVTCFVVRDDFSGPRRQIAKTLHSRVSFGGCWVLACCVVYVSHVDNGPYPHCCDVTRFASLFAAFHCHNKEGYRVAREDRVLLPAQNARQAGVWAFVGIQRPLTFPWPQLSVTLTKMQCSKTCPACRAH